MALLCLLTRRQTECSSAWFFGTPRLMKSIWNTWNSWFKSEDRGSSAQFIRILMRKSPKSTCATQSEQQYRPSRWACKPLSSACPRRTSSSAHKTTSTCGSTRAKLPDWPCSIPQRKQDIVKWEGRFAGLLMTSRTLIKYTTWTSSTIPNSQKTLYALWLSLNKCSSWEDRVVYWEDLHSHTSLKSQSFSGSLCHWLLASTVTARGLDLLTLQVSWTSSKWTPKVAVCLNSRKRNVGP